MSSLPLVLSHETALEYWRSCRTERGCIPMPRPSRTSSLPGRPTQAVFEEATRSLSWLDGTRHIFVSRQSPNKRDLAGGIVHTHTGRLPGKSLMRISNDLLIASPELCLLQTRDKNTPLVATMLLAYELCGTYSFPSRAATEPSVDPAGFKNVPPLTSIERIAAYTNTCSGISGVKDLRRMIPFICNNSASPLESILALLLTLPRRMGGYGFSKPLLNHRVALSKASLAVSHKSLYVCDLFWPHAKVAVEYDSDAWHTGSERIANDAKRRNVLEHQGIKVVSITRKQLYNQSEMDRAAKILSRHLHEYPRTAHEDWHLRKTELRQLLLFGQLDTR